MNDPGFDVPLVLVMFNRPEQTERVFQAIARARPSTLLIVSDGPRPSVPSDAERVSACRDIVSSVDWQCRVEQNYAKENLGLTRRLVSGLSWTFDLVERAVVLEDDCLPTPEFFRFMSWGLEYYSDSDRIGMICGSNLIDYRFSTDSRNVYSSFISPWGWGSWRRMWRLYDPWVSHADLIPLKRLLKDKGMEWWRRRYWINVLKNAFSSGSMWDLRLQYYFFANALLGVYPARNLVRNIGFGDEATHTTGEIPAFVSRSAPTETVHIMDRAVDPAPVPNDEFDKVLSRVIWACAPTTAARLTAANLIRYARI